ncbi:hypothetical protein EON83_08955 [bacterium]|nr:MAG: hypothetical protein EON83_08955 [bacterium]
MMERTCLLGRRRLSRIWMVRARPLLNLVMREWMVEFSVRSDEQLAFIESIPENARLQTASPKPDTSERNVLRWILPSANERITVKYTIEIPA